jgi:hypothetical protein
MHSSLWIDQLSRRLGIQVGRRSLFGIAAAAMATLATGGMSRGAEREIGTAGKNEKKCKKQAQSCKREVSAYCAYWYPGYYKQCTGQLYFCCSKAADCKVQDAKRCLRNSGW